MPATWTIDSNPKATEAKHIETLGQDEYNRRLRIAKEKVDGIGDWRTEQFMGVQFPAIALQLTQEQFEIAKDWSSARWLKLIYKLAGV